AMVDRGKYELKRGGKAESIADPPGEDDTKSHLKNWIDCIRSRKQPIAHAEIGHRSATMCHLGNIARWTGRKLTWDPAKEEFANDTEANALLSRSMRAPWNL
ncbi:MAG: gfo/Idh/MocA family oxidoreductase, partial [Candidatus Hydrogenedentes bacterium]|nr:gfo/Idh/MocA family oxidoreductase [Candidatus Hydrogenedentota bacterium]